MLNSQKKHHRYPHGLQKRGLLNLVGSFFKLFFVIFNIFYHKTPGNCNISENKCARHTELMNSDTGVLLATLQCQCTIKRVENVRFTKTCKLSIIHHNSHIHIFTFSSTELLNLVKTSSYFGLRFTSLCYTRKKFIFSKKGKNFEVYHGFHCALLTCY